MWNLHRKLLHHAAFLLPCLVLLLGREHYRDQRRSSTPKGLIGAENSSILPLFTPFEEVWLMGQVMKNVVLITNTQMVYSVSLSLLSVYTLPLFSATITPLTTYFNGSDYLKEFNASAIEHAVLLQHLSEPLLYFDAPNSKGVLIQNGTSSKRSPEKAGLTTPGYNETWLSCVNESAFYILRQEEFPQGPGLTFAMSRFLWGETPFRSADTIEVVNMTAYYRICFFNPARHDEMLILTLYPCAYPVNWSVTTGFVDGRYVWLLGEDRVYIFSLTLYTHPGTKGGYSEMAFDDFFWKANGNQGMDGLTTAVMVFLVSCIVIFVVTLSGMLYCYYEQNNEIDAKEEKEREKEKASEKWWKAMVNVPLRSKEPSGAKNLLGSKILTEATESQIGSLKTDWPERNAQPQGQLTAKSKAKGQLVSGSKSSRKGPSKVRGGIKSSRGKQQSATRNRVSPLAPTSRAKIKKRSVTKWKSGKSASMAKGPSSTGKSASKKASRNRNK